MASLDTNCLLRWLLRDIPEQCDRVDALVASQEHLVLDDAVLIEAVFALESGAKLSRTTIKAFLAHVMTQPFTMDRELWQPVLATWADHPKLSVVDVYLATKAERDGNEPLYTFDVKMVNQLSAAQRVPSIT